MKLVYIANARIPTEKAHGLQIMKMCEAFAENELEVELIIPRRINQIKEDPFSYYGAKKNFIVKKLPVFDLIVLPFLKRFGFVIESLSFIVSLFFYFLFKQKGFAYTRDDYLVLPLRLMGFKVFFEDHYLPKLKGLRLFLAKRAEKLIVVTSFLKDFYLKHGLAENKILIAPDAVDFEKFDISINKEDARRQVGLTLEKKIILYAGHLYSWKGVDILAAAASYLSDDVLLVFIGGTKKDIKKFKNRNSGLKNVLIVGYRPHCEIPVWLKAADVLVLPNSAKENISKFYTSPLKLFEYMASGRPIVASGLPSIKEVLNQSNAFLVEPDNPQKLAEGIEKTLQDHDLVDRISRQTYLDVQNYTWTKRAENILNFIKSDKN